MNSKFSKSQRVINGLKLAIPAVLVATIAAIIFFVDFERNYRRGCITCELSFGELFSDSWFQILLGIAFIVAWAIGYSYTNQKDWDEKIRRENDT